MLVRVIIDEGRSIVVDVRLQKRVLQDRPYEYRLRSEVTRVQYVPFRPLN